MGLRILEKEQRDVELDNVIPELDVAEYQEYRLSDILASRLDASNPAAFSKRSSTYAFESKTSEFRITIEVDIIATEHKSTVNIHSFTNALKSPIFFITCGLFSAIACILVLAAIFSPSIIFTSFPVQDTSTLDKQYSLIVDRCAAVMNDWRSSPRIYGALYATCDKAMVQLDELCKEYHIAICQDERLELYHVRK
ncbi:MAG: hypothetical protein ACJ703_00900 [Nitrososphaera sp.]